MKYKTIKNLTEYLKICSNKYFTLCNEITRTGQTNKNYNEKLRIKEKIKLIKEVIDLKIHIKDFKQKNKGLQSYYNLLEINGIVGRVIDFEKIISKKVREIE